MKRRKKIRRGCEGSRKKIEREGWKKEDYQKWRGVNKKIKSRGNLRNDFFFFREIEGDEIRELDKNGVKVELIVGKTVFSPWPCQFFFSFFILFRDDDTTRTQVPLALVLRNLRDRSWKICKDFSRGYKPPLLRLRAPSWQTRICCLFMF